MQGLEAMVYNKNYGKRNCYVGWQIEEEATKLEHKLAKLTELVLMTFGN